MRGLWLGLLAALAGCDKAPAPARPENAALATASAAPVTARLKSGKGRALLDRLLAPRQAGPYAPRDDCAGLPGATKFRQALADAVAAGDADAIAAMALPDVKLGFGGEDGRERFRAALAEPGSKVMTALAELLPLGCAADAQAGVTMPWYFAQDFGDIDSSAAMLVVGGDVPLHAAPDPASAVKQRISWDLVVLDGGLQPGRPLQQVTTAQGARGWMPAGKLRSMLAYRLLAARQGGAWRISALVAGD